LTKQEVSAIIGLPARVISPANIVGRSKNFKETELEEKSLLNN
jgi:hypothetical protein